MTEAERLLNELILNVGKVTAYADAVAGGYTGTREEWEEALAGIGSEAAAALAAKNAAEAAQTAAETAQSAAETAGNAAAAAASSAADDASDAHIDALAATAAKEAAETAQLLAEDAKASASAAKGAAETAQGKAEDAQEAAEAAQTAAETAQAAAETAETNAETAQTGAETARAAAEAVLESIPEDYSELSSDVTDLKSAYGHKYHMSETDFVQGTKAATTGNNMASTTRLRSTFWVSCETIGVIPDDGYKISIYAYSGSTYMGIWNGSGFVKSVTDTNFTSKGWMIGNLPQNYTYRVLLAKNDDSTIETSDYYHVTFLGNCFSILGDTLPIIYSEETNGKYIGANGTIGDAEYFHYSELIPVKYDTAYKYSFLYSTYNTTWTMRIHGYDVNGNWVKQLRVITDVAESTSTRIAIDDITITAIRISIDRRVGDEQLCPYISPIDAIENNSDKINAIAGESLNIGISWDADAEGKYIGEDGTIGESASFHYSDLLPVIAGTYDVSYLRHENVSARIRIHGYDENGEWVKQLATYSETTGYFKHSFTVSDQIKYIRLSFRTDMTDILLNVEKSILSALSDMQNNTSDIKYGMPMGSVNLTTANAVCRCLTSYLEHNSNFIYGQNGTATKWNENGFIDSETGKYRIDCSTLALLTVMGIDYDHSLYNLSNTDNIFAAMDYGWNPFWGKEYPWNAHDLYGTYTWQMCEEYAKRGLTFDIINRDFSGVQPGDLIFWGKTGESSYRGRYKWIHHVNVVVGRYGEKDAIVVDAGQVPIVARLASNTLSSNDVQVVARLPLGICPVNTLNVISEKYDTTTTESTFEITTSPTLYTPVAAKFRITQTASEGSIALTDNQGGNIFAAKTFNAGTNGKTYDIIARGYTRHSINFTTLTVTATGANIESVAINYPATCVEKE